MNAPAPQDQQRFGVFSFLALETKTTVSLPFLFSNQGKPLQVGLFVLGFLYEHGNRHRKEDTLFMLKKKAHSKIIKLEHYYYTYSRKHT